MPSLQLPAGWQLAEEMSQQQLIPGEPLVLYPEIIVGDHIGPQEVSVKLHCLAQQLPATESAPAENPVSPAMAPAIIRQLRREIPVRPPFQRVNRSGTIALDGGQSWLGSSVDFELMSGEWQLRVGPLSSSALQRATNSLNHYPYGCAEQTVSRALPWLALAGQAGQDHADPLVVEQRLEQALRRLQFMQTSDGGIAMWPSHRHSWKTASLWTAWFASLAKASGHAVPDGLFLPLLDWCRQQSQQPVHNLRGNDAVIQHTMAQMILALNGLANSGDLAAIDARLRGKFRWRWQLAAPRDGRHAGGGLAAPGSP